MIGSCGCGHCVGMSGAWDALEKKLCPEGKAAAKRKFKVYPSAYANMYASAVCSGKVTPGGKKRAKKAMGGTANPRQMYGKGGGVCKRGKGRAYGKNS